MLWSGVKLAGCGRNVLVYLVKEVARFSLRLRSRHFLICPRPFQNLSLKGNGE